MSARELSGLLEKLVESWLDSINERGYQSAYCSLLCNEGHQIVHNTRHSPIENGKDIITIAPDGSRHLIQLKGNPGQRFKQSDFASHSSQMNLLACLRWDDTDEVTELPFFVTNGEVEEEARLAFQQHNASLQKMGFKPITVVARGELLSRFLGSIQSIAPADPIAFGQFVSFLNLGAEQDFEFDALFKFFFGLFDASGHSKPLQFEREANSCCLLAELLCSRSESNFDPYSVIIVRISALAAILAAKKKQGHKLKKTTGALIRLFSDQMTAQIGDLAFSLSGRERHFLDGPLLSDGIQISFRREMVASLIASMLVDFGRPTHESRFNFLSEELEDTCVRVLRGALADMQLWGEASVARYLLVYLVLSNRAGGGDADRYLRKLTFTYRHLAASKQGAIFPNAFYSYDEFVRNFVFPELANIDDVILTETFLRRSHFFRPLFLLCARKNWKTTCKFVWAEMTKYIHVDVKYPSSWTLPNCPDDNAEWQDIIYPDSIIWPDALGEAEEHELGEVIELFDGDLFLACVFLSICPFRMNTNTILTLDRMLGDSINLENTNKFRNLRK